MFQERIVFQEREDVSGKDSIPGKGRYFRKG
jgi:hypothetical protein